MTHIGGEAQRVADVVGDASHRRIALLRRDQRAQIVIRGTFAADRIGAARRAEVERPQGSIRVEHHALVGARQDNAAVGCIAHADVRRQRAIDRRPTTDPRT
ncbi:hypothetical protein D3C86_895380 [compost metagenome]